MTKSNRSDAETSPEAILDLSVAVIELYFRIEAATQAIAGFAQAGGEWGVLRMLSIGGPQTVPAMARSRPVSRQHVQTIVNDLEARALAERIDNPRHKRSPLVRITPAGQTYFDAMTQRFLHASATLAPRFDATEVETATRVLRDAREMLAAP